MSLENQVERVSKGFKDTLKTLINKLGGNITDELIDEYPNLLPDLNLQDRITGAAGQVVGFDEDGNAVAQDSAIPSAHASTHASDGSDPITPASIGAAPDGYGLGTTAKRLTTDDNIDDICESGFYGWFDSTPQNAVNSYSAMRVENNSYSGHVVQTFLSWNDYNKSYCQYRRIKNDNGWQPLEYIDPPFATGAVYRTTERHLGNPVYKKMDSNGVIWWSTDQSTWKREAERVGAMPTFLTGGFLDGIPNLNETNHRITGPGWFRILRTKGNDTYLIHLGHGYNSSGPEDILFHVCVDRYAPSIVILSNSVHSLHKFQFYTKIRITYDDTYSYVDFYYDRDNPNSVQSNILWFNKNRVGCQTEPLLLSQVDDAPDGETIVLVQDVSIIPSGNVVTSGSQLYTYSTTDLTAGSSSLETGKLYFVYE